MIIKIGRYTLTGEQTVLLKKIVLASYGWDKSIRKEKEGAQLRGIMKALGVVVGSEKGSGDDVP